MGTKANDPMNDLRSRCLARAEEIAAEINGDLLYVPDEDIESCLADLTEDNWRRKADDLAELAAWFN